MSIKSGLSEVRGLGSAKSGSHHWWLQRLTALALIPTSIWFVVSVLCHMNYTHSEFVEWLNSPVVTVMMIAFLISIFYHLSLGLQVVIEDYIHSEVIKISSLVTMKLGTLLGVLTGIVSVLKISFGTG